MYYEMKRILPIGILVCFLSVASSIWIDHVRISVLKQRKKVKYQTCGLVMSVISIISANWIVDDMKEILEFITKLKKVKGMWDVLPVLVLVVPFTLAMWFILYLVNKLAKKYRMPSKYQITMSAEEKNKYHEYKDIKKGKKGHIKWLIKRSQEHGWVLLMIVFFLLSAWLGIICIRFAKYTAIWIESIVNDTHSIKGTKNTDMTAFSDTNNTIMKWSKRTKKILSLYIAIVTAGPRKIRRIFIAIVKL